MDEFNILNRPSRENVSNIDGPGYDHILKNNMSFAQFGTGTSNMPGDLNTTENNTWNLGIKVSAEDFLSTEMDQLTRPRQADGSLPDIELLFPSNGSAIIDAGLDIGFSYKGNAPDLGAIEFDQTTSIDLSNTDLIKKNSLANFPNPFEFSTTIRYSLKQSGDVRLSIYDLNGQLVKELIVDQKQDPAVFQVEWDRMNQRGEVCLSGFYFCKLINSNSKGSQVMIRKMILN